MKNIYLVQVSTVYGEGEKKNAYLPYAAGCIAAYSWADKRVKAEYNLGKFIYTRENIEKAVEKLDNPYLVGFSCYIWNIEYNIAFSKVLKERYPDCITVFGGHHIAPDSHQLSEIPTADILIHGGGEEAFKEILLALSDNSPLENINNISFRSDDGFVTTQKKNPETTDYPSPYLEGIFDNILNDGISFSALLETNRGCPNQCAFCDWGFLKCKVRLFPMERVKAELDWIAEKKIEYVYGCDANFGLFNRDLEIAEYLTQLKQKTGYPQKFKVNFTKNKFDVVGKISKLLVDNNMSKAQTISLQSVSPEVLEIIGRKNLDMEYYSDLVNFYAKENIPTYTELILGLPGETYESFAKGMCKVLESGQHSAINVYPCELIPNSLLGSKEYIEKYKIKTVHNRFIQYHINPDTVKEDIDEFSSLIVETSTMSVADWEKTYLFAVTVQALHALGLTRYIAVALKKYRNISYYDFYNRFIEKALNDASSDFIHTLWTSFREHFSAVANKNGAIGMIDDRFGHIIYEPDEMLFSKCLIDEDKFFPELKNYVSEITGDEEFTKEIVAFQKFIMNKPVKQNETMNFSYDFASFFNTFFGGNEDITLEKKNTIISTKCCLETENWADFVRVAVWYSRRMANSTVCEFSADNQ